MTLLGFQARVDEADIPCKGITDIAAADHAYARQLKATIKLLGVSKRVPGPGGEGKDGGEGAVAVFVSPMLVDNENTIAKCSLATNIVQVDSQFMGTSSFIGQGAGRFPTANSIVSDLVHIAQDACPAPFPDVKDVVIDNNFSARFYVRLNVKDQLGIIRITGQLCEDNNVSIHAILQTPIDDPDNVAFAITTEPCLLSQIEALCASLSSQEFSNGAPFFMPFL